MIFKILIFKIGKNSFKTFLKKGLAEIQPGQVLIFTKIQAESLINVTLTKECVHENKKLKLTLQNILNNIMQSKQLLKTLTDRTS